MKYPSIDYHDYLKLNQILGSQKLRSEEFGKTAHEEMLFIVVHQTYELWFKQILWDLDSVLKEFGQTDIPESTMGQVASRLDRIQDIFKFVLGQIDLLETMTPLDFLDFRDYLYPASGFQSFQFRLIETKLGLRPEDRLTYNQSPFYKHLEPEQQNVIQKVIQAPSLFELVENWLGRTPFLKDSSFWKSYQEAVEKMFSQDEKTVTENPRLAPPDRDRNLEMLRKSKEIFSSLYSKEAFQKLQDSQYFRLNHSAVQAALFILLYRDEPVLQIPFRLIQTLMDLDETMAQWRYRHSLMAHRMLGKKIGTGGSSGSDYLQSTVEKHKVFRDFFNLTTFLIPRSARPTLPKDLRDQMDFKFR